MPERPELGFRPTVGASLRRAAGRWPDGELVVVGDHRRTFAAAEEVRARAATELSASKVPARVELLTDGDAIPWLASGKPDKRALQARLLGTEAAGPGGG